MPSLPCGSRDPLLQVCSLFSNHDRHGADPILQVDSLFGVSYVPEDTFSAVQSNSCLEDTRPSDSAVVYGNNVDVPQEYVPVDEQPSHSPRRPVNKIVIYFSSHSRSVSDFSLVILSVRIFCMYLCSESVSRSQQQAFSAQRDRECLPSWVVVA